ncbi:hypothetical protein OP10G_1884 [Fimbriimonas ginsengisoli Gsoil 348]|uniref:Uncharacterized protein n=1 Tax=Fimbriimonas ginsengisoli Gsoil 348 TaxID=661478 RepID=A0A068NPF1_FIMGI|nr:hypothetical protein OP10G_1884 [Fimbriimonas ginsengisoli Gsoil 348]
MKAAALIATPAAMAKALLRLVVISSLLAGSDLRRLLTRIKLQLVYEEFI